MSDFDEKLEQRRSDGTGRARQDFERHMARYQRLEVRYVGEDYKPALQVLALSADKHQGQRVPMVVVVHAMPQVSVWRRVSLSGTEFEHVLTLQAEWDTGSRSWRLLGINRTESRWWPAFAPRHVKLGPLLPQGESHVQHPVPIVKFATSPRSSPSPRQPRRR